MFKQTIIVFNKIAQKVKESEGNRIEYVVSEKQFNWLAETYIKEAKGWDTRFGATVTDEEGNQYSFSYKKKMHNVPHYIPNRKQYGLKYFITKHLKNGSNS